MSIDKDAAGGQCAGACGGYKKRVEIQNQDTTEAGWMRSSPWCGRQWPRSGLTFTGRSMSS